MNNPVGGLLQVGLTLVTFVGPVFAGALPTPTPEPATVLLIGGGLGAMILIARRKQK
jgi:hypothetical protein